jgi:hypothetical protein
MLEHTPLKSIWSPGRVMVEGGKSRRLGHSPPEMWM